MDNNNNNNNNNNKRPKTDPPHSDAGRQSACYHPPRTPAQAAYSRRRHRNKHWQWNREAPSTTATHNVSAYRSVALHASMVLLHCAVRSWLRKPPYLRYRRVKMHEILWLTCRTTNRVLKHSLLHPRMIEFFVYSILMFHIILNFSISSFQCGPY